METNIDDLMSFKETVIGDTGWIDFEFIPEVDKNTRFRDEGFNCGLREIRFGNIRIKSIRLNVGKMPHDKQIAYIPKGFITKNQYFNAVTNGNVKPIRIAMETDGTLKTYINSDDRNRSDLWVYQQFTWLE